MPTKYSMPKLAIAIAAMITLTGCVEAIEQLNRDLAAANATMSGAGTAPKPGTMARMDESVQQQKIQLIVPKDPKVEEAVDAALPTIKKMLSVHQCARQPDALLQLNALAVPGVDVRSTGIFRDASVPNNSYNLKYHDFTKCLSVRSIDQFEMPALNALKFRTIYFADDSGETLSYMFLLKKTDDGSWRIAQPPKRY